MGARCIDFIDHGRWIDLHYRSFRLKILVINTLRMNSLVKYIVISTKNRTLRNMDSADEVATFLLGRNLSHWSVYQLQDKLPSDIAAIKARLLASENPPVWTFLDEIRDQSEYVRGEIMFFNVLLFYEKV